MTAATHAVDATTTSGTAVTSASTTLSGTAVTLVSLLEHDVGLFIWKAVASPTSVLIIEEREVKDSDGGLTLSQRQEYGIPMTESERIELERRQISRVKKDNWLAPLVLRQANRASRRAFETFAKHMCSLAREPSFDVSQYYRQLLVEQCEASLVTWFLARMPRRRFAVPEAYRAFLQRMPRPHVRGAAIQD
eukprot:6964009-Prymnesium_polylepis.1